MPFPLAQSLAAMSLTPGQTVELRETLAALLSTSGWLDELRDQCRALVFSRGHENWSVDDLVRMLLANNVPPASVKEQFLRQLLHTLRER